ncbi:MAG: hypothetical protein J7K29_01470 [Candidatus Cloacimonetes bacterium]|nr:hypothetical protein [Candidatus Cloacimonadota bacterium]
MNYALRNTVILSILLVLVVLGFLLGNSVSVRKLNDSRTLYENNQKKLDDLVAANPDMNDRDIFIKKLEDLEIKAQRESKLIPIEDNPTITYKYLLDICDNFCQDFKFNFVFNNLSVNEDINFNKYTITGNVPIRSLYSFIYQFEKQYMLYIIESIKIVEEMEEGVLSNNVNFTIVFNAYFQESIHEIGKIPFRKLKYKNLEYSPFYSRIHLPLPDELEKGFLDTSSAGIIGLSANKVFMKDKTGKVHKLKLGDRVAYGTLKSINWKEHYAVFQLNEIGIIKDRKIYLNELKEESK